MQREFSTTVLAYTFAHAHVRLKPQTAQQSISIQQRTASPQCAVGLLGGYSDPPDKPRDSADQWSDNPVL